MGLGLALGRAGRRVASDEAEVDEEGTRGREEDVLGLHVAVEDPQRVAVDQGLGHRREELKGFLGLERASQANPVLEGLACDEVHDQVVEAALAPPEVLDADQAGVPEGG